MHFNPKKVPITFCFTVQLSSTFEHKISDNLTKNL
jgi:hypothetical protein